MERARWPGAENNKVLLATENDPGQQPARRWEPQSFSQEEVNLANGSSEVGSPFFSGTTRWELRWAKAGM